MTNEPDRQAPEARMDPAALYREEVFTDRKAGTVRRLSPVNADGSTDPSRKPVYVGEAHMLTPAGALPLTFEVQASSLGEAVARYHDAVQQAADRALAELEELRRRAASSIVIPRGGAAGLGDLGQGGLPGGGKLKL